MTIEQELEILLRDTRVNGKRYKLMIVDDPFTEAELAQKSKRHSSSGSTTRCPDHQDAKLCLTTN